MSFDRHQEMGAWWPMGIGMIICLVIIGLVIWLVVRTMNQRPGSGHGEPAEEILRRRFAAGEIDEEEYAKRVEVLRRK